MLFCGLFAVLGTATADGSGETGSSGSSGTDGDNGIVSRIEHIASLETELEAGEPYSTGPGADAIARAVTEDPGHLPPRTWKGKLSS